MPGKKVSDMTWAINKAHKNIMDAYNIADSKHAAIPLMHKVIDPRTAKKRQEWPEGHMRFNPNEREGEARFELSSQPEEVQQRDRAVKNPPKKPTRELQSKKTMNAGIVVEPRALESGTMATALSPGGEVDVM